MEIVAVDADRSGAVLDFFDALPEEDRTFIKEDLSSADAVRALLASAGTRWLAVDDAGGVQGYLALVALSGWSDHVAEVRLVVRSAARGQGVGRALARHALRTAVADGRRKLVVELVADQSPALKLFTDLGFEGEALLRDHIRDNAGELRDLIMLAHFVDGTRATMTSYGLADEFFS